MKVVGVVIELIVIGCAVLWMRLLMKTVLSNSSFWVLRNLRKTGKAQLRHVWRFEGVWNPAGRPNVDDRVFGPGKASYALDQACIVHLEFHERGGRVLLRPSPGADEAPGT